MHSIAQYLIVRPDHQQLVQLGVKGHGGLLLLRLREKLELTDTEHRA